MSAQLDTLAEPVKLDAQAVPDTARDARMVIGLPSELLRKARARLGAPNAPDSLNALLVEALLVWLFWMESRPSVDVYVADQNDLEWLLLEVPTPVMLRWMRAIARGALGEEEGAFQRDGLPARSFSGSLCCALEMRLEELSEA